jgi:hypothetical protein
MTSTTSELGTFRTYQVRLVMSVLESKPDFPVARLNF